MIDRIRNARHRYRRGLLYPAAMLTLGASAIHLSVAPDHLEEFPPFGILFLVIGAVQLALAPLVVILPGRRVFVTAMAVAAACLLVWGASRTVGLPVGPHPGQPEAIGLADALTSIFEVLSLLVFLLLLTSSPPRSRRRWWLAGTVPAGVLLTIATVIGVVAGINPLPFGVNMSSAGPGGSNVTMADLKEQPGRQPEKDFTVTAQVAHISVFGGLEAWTYNGTVPGPELRVRQGDRLRVTLINHLPAATSIHWHGLRLPNAEDGVAGITQDAVPPGGQYTYEFVVKDPGTYWYHSHQDTEDQVPLGLYGALVVEPAQGPAYDRDYTVLLGDANRTRPIQLDAKPGELVRLRAISAFMEDMNGTPELLVLLGAPYRVIALDGHDLNGPTEMGVELLPLGTGQRYDLAFRMPASGRVRLLDVRPQTGSAEPARDWASLGDGAMPQLNAGMPVFDRSKPLGYVSGSLATFDPTSYGIAAPDPVASRGSYDVSNDLVITNQPGLRYGSHLDRVPLKLIHMFNGKSFPDTVPIVVREGQYVRLRLVNDTDEYHPIHLHGHVFSVISRNGKPLTGSPVHLDSILVGPHETWVGAFLADNPGLWMLHCHVLIHAAFGLSTMVSYEGVTTPYVIGSKSGNFPE
ncbi:MAG TPA: multicopper oxidase family protein [Candidatus Dormibacteraeota bacterium]|nr:multicopper oxidase family protein [Candidatus Dormibacteraeota bacterium]